MSSPKHEELPRRDWVILPLLSLLTVLMLAVVAETGARYVFVESGSESCGVPDALHGYRIKSNCVSHKKAAEGLDVEMAYNDCGYRTPERCSPKAVGAIRVAVLGASTAQGFKVPYDRIFTARATSRLTTSCGRPVEFQNMGVPGYKPLDSYLRIDEALAIKPDLVMMVIVPFDMEDLADRKTIENRSHPDMLRRMRNTPEPVVPQAPAAPRPLLARANDLINLLVLQSRAVLVAQHFLFADNESFIKLQLKLGDKADYLRTPITPAWEKRYADLDLLLGEMATEIHRAGIPFLLVFGTQHAQAALVDFPDSLPGIDPEAAGRRVGEIAKRHGILFADTFAAFRKARDPSTLFYPADGHMNPGGHVVFADALIERLARGDIQVFADCGQMPQASR